MKRLFDIAAGSVQGRAHALAGRNNQDAFAICTNAGAVAAVACDGCSGGHHSEVGAALGARLLARALANRAGPDADATIASALQDVVGHLARLADTLGGAREELVNDCFLFTIVACLATPERTTVFAVGDGCFALDGEVTRLGPFPNNAPPYLGYALLGDDTARPTALVSRPTDRIQSVLLATDGLDEWLNAPADRVAQLGDALQFAREDRFFANPDMVRRRLAMAAKAPSLLQDDTTVVALRRARVEEAAWTSI